MKKSTFTPSEAVLAYVAKHTTPNPDVLPNPGVYYTGKSKGKEWFKMYFPVTGEVIDIDPSNYSGWRARINMRIAPDGNYAKSTSTPLVFSYIDYDPEFEVLEFGAAYVPNKRPDRSMEKDIRKWEFTKNVRRNRYCPISFDRYFLVKSTGKTVYNEHGQVQTNGFVGQYGGRYQKFSHYINECGKHYQRGAKRSLASIFAEFNGSEKYYGTKGALYDFSAFYQLQVWYEHAQRPRGKGKVQELINELIPLVKIPEKEKFRNNGFYYQNLGNGWSAFAQIKHTTYRDGAVLMIDPHTLEMTYVILFNEKGDVHYAEFNGKEWVSSSSVLNSYGDRNLQNPEDAITGSDRLKWIRNSGFLEEKEGKVRVDKVVLCLKRPVLENLYKLGYENIANYYQRQYLAAFERNLGKIGKTGNFYRQLGFSKAQLELIEGKYAKYNSRDYFSYSNNGYNPSKGLEYTIKACLGVNDIGSYQVTQVSDWIDMLNEVFGRYGYLSVKETLCKMFRSLPEDRRLIALNRLAKIQNTATIIETNNRYQPREYRSKYYLMGNVLRDSVSVLSKFDDETFSEVINNLVHFDKIESMSDLQRFHDNVVGLYNAKMFEIEMRKNKEKDEKMKKIDEKRKGKYETEDDNFIIRLPISAGEITIEGSTLHHCVGGYVDRHVSGQTTILFLRRKSAPDTPFYTIEIREDEIIQIHGFGNKWLGNDPDAIPTVVKWIKERKFICNRSIILSASSHYGSSGAQKLDAKKYGVDW